MQKRELQFNFQPIQSSQEIKAGIFFLSLRQTGREGIPNIFFQ